MADEATRLDRHETNILDVVAEAHRQREEHHQQQQQQQNNVNDVAVPEQYEVKEPPLDRQETDILEVLLEAHEQVAENDSSDEKTKLSGKEDPASSTSTKDMNLKIVVGSSIPEKGSKNTENGTYKDILARTNPEANKPNTAAAILAMDKPESTKANPVVSATTPARVAANTSQRQMDAGAYHTSPDGQVRLEPFNARMLQQTQHTPGSLSTMTPTAEERSHPAPADATVPVADQVMDESSRKNLPEAEEWDIEQQQNRTKERNRTCSAVWGAGILAVIALSLILTFLLAGDAPTAASQMPVTSQPTGSPTGAPTSSESYVLALLPEDQEPSSVVLDAIDWLVMDPNFFELTDHRIKQRLALASLYYATKGDNWVFNENWMSYEVHECQWHSINVTGQTDPTTWFDPEGRLSYASLSEEVSFPCNEDGVYQHLWLPANDLVGEIPDELYLLTSLKSIILGKNQELGGTICSNLGLLTDLIWLDLGPSNINGTIPTELGLLTNLHELFVGNLGGLYGTFPSELGLLSNIEYEFNFVGNLLTGTIPTEFGNFRKADFFDVRGNQLNGTIPSEIGQLTNVRWLRLDRNSLSGQMPSELGNLDQLERLFVHANQLSGTIPSEFGAFTSLKFFYMFQNQFSGLIPSELGLLTDATDFYIFDSKLTGTIPTELGALTSTTGLYINGNELTGAIPSEFGLLTILQTLDLDINLLSGTIPTELGMMEGMLSLEFADNSLTGTIPSELGLLANLYVLYAQGNKLTGTLPDEFVSLVYNGTGLLAEVNITNTMISGQLSEDFCGMGGTGEEDCHGWWIPSCALHFDCSSFLCGCHCPCLSFGSSALDSRAQGEP